MQAAVLYGPGDLRVEEVDDPKVRDGYALVRVQTCGVCPSDVRRFYGTDSFEPWTPGHEVTGVVADIAGRPVAGLAIGDRVVADWRVVGGRCFFCLDRDPHFSRHPQDFPLPGGAAAPPPPPAP